MAAALETEAVWRRFGPVVAVQGASVSIEAGLVHAIVGENGAGKSTLLKIAAGLVAPDAGRVLAGGRPLAPSHREAMARGIGMVHQHFMLVGAMTALDNLMLGAEPTRAGGLLDRPAAAARARAVMEESGLSVPLEALADALTVGERQRLEILRLLFRGAEVMLLDEPTAVLSPLEVLDLYAVLRRLARAGKAVAVVTHRLDEVMQFADRATVVRRGQVVLSTKVSDTSAADLTRAIMGGEPPPAFSRPRIDEQAPPVLELEHLALRDASGRALLDDIAMTIRPGEIVGVAGVEGNGQRELVRALAGLEPRVTGRIAVGGEELAKRDALLGKQVTSARARRALLSVVHEDRHEDGLLLEATVADNLVLGDLGDLSMPRVEAAARGTKVRLGARPADWEAKLVAERIARFDVRPPDPARLAGELSGGNQQKLVVARALDRIAPLGRKAVAVLAQPTRGVDIGAAAIIHEAIGRVAAAGLAVLVVSADLGELRSLAHRIVVLRRGKIVAELPPDTPDLAVGRAMLGIEGA